MATGTSTATEPTHHLTLYDGTTTYGIICCDQNGIPTPYGITRVPIERSSIKFSEGATEYSDLEFPYTPIAQNDWSGGRGLENFDRDETRFYDSWRANTMLEGEIILGGQETYTSGYRELNEVAFTDVNWTSLTGNTRYLAVKFTVGSTAYTAGSIYLWIRRIGTPTGTLTAALYTDSSGDIGSAIANGSATVTTSTITDKESVWHKFTIGQQAAFTASTAYWLRVHDTAAGTATNCWQVATSTTAGETEQSADGSAWTDPASVGLYYRIVDGDDDFRAHFFEYRGAMYMATQEDDGGAGAIYINGDRGACDSGTTLTVVDATKSWTTNEWAGCVVKIVTGDASGDDPNWRYIVSNTSNTLTISPAWKSTLTSGADDSFGSEYVILGSDKWTLVSPSGDSISDPITDVAVADETVFFACGEDPTNTTKSMYRYKGASDAGGIWSDALLSEKEPGTAFMEVIRDPIDGLMIHIARNEGLSDQDSKVHIVSCKVPPFKQRLEQPVVIDMTEAAWDESTDGDVTSTNLAPGGYDETGRRGIKLVVNDLSDELGAGTILATQNITGWQGGDLDIRHCSKIKGKIRSSIDMAAGDLQLLLDDTASCASAVHSLDMPALRAGIWTDYELDLTISDADGSEKIISVGVNLVTDKTPNYTELLSNTGFETAGGGGADVFANWTEVAGSGTITQDGTVYNGGAKSCKMVMTDASDDCKVHQTVTVTAGEWYIFQGYCYGDATEDTQYGIYDVTNSADIVAKTNTGDTAAEWDQFNKMFQAPADCVSVRLDLWASDAAGTVYWDDVKLVKAEFQIDLLSIRAIPDNDEIPVGDQTELITGLASYGEPRMLHVFKEGSIWSVENNIPVEIPIEELKSVKSLQNGRAHTINDVYLYFSLKGGRIERYYRQNIDDIGPTQDAGLPYGRKGEINDLVTYPGMIIASVDGHYMKTYITTPSSGTTVHYSSVVAYRNGGWHELFRYQWGRIRGMYIESVPGRHYDRLWINCGSEIVWIPISLNPYYDDDYPYTHESSIVSSWHYMKLQDISKLFKSLKLIADRLSGTAQTVEVEYQTDDATDSSTWNSVDDTDRPFNTSPVEELDFSTDSPPDVTGRRIRYRLRLLSNDNDKTPRVRATVLEAVARVPVKFAYDVTFRAMDESLDLEGDDDDYTTIQTLTAQLDSWATANTPLTARFVFSPFDSVAGSATGRTVFIDPASLRPLYLVPDDQLETHIGQFRLVEA